MLSFMMLSCSRQKLLTKNVNIQSTYGLPWYKKAVNLFYLKTLLPLLLIHHTARKLKVSPAAVKKSNPNSEASKSHVQKDVLLT